MQLAFSDVIYERQSFLIAHSHASPTKPSLTARQRNFVSYCSTFVPTPSCGSIEDAYQLVCHYKLPIVKHMIRPLLPHFVLPLSHPNPSLAGSIAEDFALTTKRYEEHQPSMTVSVTNRTGVLDNSANVHVLRDKCLFIGNINPCPLGVDVGTVVESNKPEGMGLAQIKWHDVNNILHEILLQDALCFPDSPVNVISITKLGLDSRDNQLSI